MPTQAAIDSIKKDEGLRLSSYKDKLGVNTIGYGFNLERDGADFDLESVGVKDVAKIKSGEVKLTKEQANQLFEMDFEKASKNGRDIFKNWNDMPSDVRDSLANMIFQLGRGGVLKFKDMRSAIEKGDYHGAGKEMLDSLWATQTPERAKRASKALKKAGDAVVRPKVEVKPRSLQERVDIGKQEARDGLQEEIAGLLDSNSLKDELADLLGGVDEEAQVVDSSS